MSLPATLAVTLPAPILETILTRLLALFLTATGGDRDAARQAARGMLAAYHPETEAELHLAADIISFGFHALEALSQSADPDLKLSAILRLRGSAVSLSREAHKAQRKLDQLQRDRRAGVPQPVPQPKAEEPEPAPNPPAVHEALELIECAREAIQAKKHGGMSWTQQFQQRQTAKRLAEKLRKKQAKDAARLAATAAAMPERQSMAV
jgi:hypothetical protein